MKQVTQTYSKDYEYQRAGGEPVGYVQALAKSSIRLD